MLTSCDKMFLFMSTIVTGADYLDLPRDPESWLVENLLPTGGSMLLFGDPKVGKSFAALQLSIALSQGHDWLGFPVPNVARVVYIQLDTPRTLWADRVQALRDAGHGTDSVYFADRETLDCFPFDVLNPEHFAMLTRSLHDINPGAVIIDTLREAHSGDENNSTAMQNVISRIDAAVKPAAMILISHARKGSPEFGYNLINDNRGSNYIVGRMDSIVRFSHSSMRCSSRTLEEHSVKLERIDDGTWILAADPIESEAEILIQSNPQTSLRELARMLAKKVDRSESACRAYLRRKKQSTPL